MRFVFSLNCTQRTIGTPLPLPSLLAILKSIVAMSCQPSGSEQVVMNVCNNPAWLDPLPGSLTPLLGGVNGSGLPFQSPAKGRSPVCPKLKKKVFAGSKALTLLRKKMFTEGRNTPIVSIPSPFQSPAKGRSSAIPNAKEMSAAPPEFELRRKKVLMEGRNTPMVSIPSPSQSPASGRSPADPKVKTGTSAAGEELFTFLLLVKNHWLVEGRNTPIVSMPSPSQSPTTARSPLRPKLMVIVVVGS